MAENNNLFTKEELMCQGIYDLRELGRSVGVPSPTTLKKEDLVEKILSVVYGTEPSRKVGKGRGRPARTSHKPCKLFMDMVEQLETPQVNTSFIYDGDEAGTSFNYSSLFSSKVASPKQEYINNDSDPSSEVQKGVVCVESDGIFVRKFRAIQGENDAVLPLELFKKLSIRDNDLIEYFLDESGRTVSQVFRINGVFSRAGQAKKEKVKDVDLSIGENVVIKTNTSNVICLPQGSDRKAYVDLVTSVFKKLDFKIVRVLFDGHMPASENVADLNLTCAGDEYETIAIAEEGMDRLAYLDRMGQKCVLIVDNLNWLMNVISTYPKSLYGSFIARLGRLPLGDTSSITVVCLASNLSKEKLESVADVFGNIVIE